MPVETSEPDATRLREDEFGKVLSAWLWLEVDGEADRSGQFPQSPSEPSAAWRSTLAVYPYAKFEGTPYTGEDATFRTMLDERVDGETKKIHAFYSIVFLSRDRTTALKHNPEDRAVVDERFKNGVVFGVLSGLDVSDIRVAGDIGEFLASQGERLERNDEHPVTDDDVIEGEWVVVYDAQSPPTTPDNDGKLDE